MKNVGMRSGRAGMKKDRLGEVNKVRSHVE